MATITELRAELDRLLAEAEAEPEPQPEILGGGQLTGPEPEWPAFSARYQPEPAEPLVASHLVSEHADTAEQACLAWAAR